MTPSPDRIASDPFTGAEFGARYRLEGLIGRGGMASVYRGTDLVLGRAVAVKVFAAEVEGADVEGADGAGEGERRRSETALLASLSHRALVRLYDASRDPATGREFLVMELVDGRDLRELLRLGPLSPADAAGMTADLAEALHVIHDRGIVHRDVKPANVLLEPAHLPGRTWNAKLADFGIARLIDDARLTRSGLLIGTPGYLSPEQVSGVAPGPAADIYSLGLLVLEARTGRTAFPGPAIEAAGARLVRDPDIPDALGSDWVALLRAMTVREPDERPTALEVAIAATALDTSAPGSASADHGEHGEPGDTATVAYADVATDALADATRPAPTRVLPAPDRSFFAMPAAAAPKAMGAMAPPATATTIPTPMGRQTAATRLTASPIGARSAASETPASPAEGRRWVRPAIVVGLLAALAVVLVLTLQSVLIAPAAVPTPAPLPSIPGQLGVHLEQLEEAVTG